MKKSIRASRIRKASRKAKRAVKSGRDRVPSPSFTTEVIGEAIGEEALPVVNYLRGRKNISEFVIAKRIKYEVRSVRKMLYALQNQNLVTYFRKKDREKGWYISYWTFNPLGVRELQMAMQRNKLQQLRERLGKEEANKGLFYICPNMCSRMEFEKATEQDFKCPECGKTLMNQDNTRTIESLKENIIEIEKETAVA